MSVEFSKPPRDYLSLFTQPRSLSARADPLKSQKISSQLPYSDIRHVYEQVRNQFNFALHERDVYWSSGLDVSYQGWNEHIYYQNARIEHEFANEQQRRESDVAREFASQLAIQLSAQAKINDEANDKLSHLQNPYNLSQESERSKDQHLEELRQQMKTTLDLHILNRDEIKFIYEVLSDELECGEIEAPTHPTRY